MFLILCFFSSVLSAFLLFLIEPMSAKVLLPLFGGVPAVWNVCMVFFQGVLLIGYLYVFLLSRYINPIFQRGIHFSGSLISLFSLPILWKSITIEPNLSPTFNILWLLFTKITLPLFIVSATAPLIQYWFSQTHHPDAKDPYFLYSASNIGSFLALLGFPFLLEPYIGLQHLAYHWSLGYGLFVGSFFLIGIYSYSKKIIPKEVIKPLTSITAKQRLSWTLLSFGPSCLLIAVTQYITTEILSAPLFWILPLAIYLLAFIIVFARKPLISHQWMVKEQVLFLIFPLISLSKTTLTLPAIFLIVFHLLGFFSLIMVCLGELVNKRPEKTYLTEFYLWIALGGFLGGLFTSLIAPQIFKGVYEYYLAICFCIAMRPLLSKTHVLDKSLWIFPISIMIVLTLNYFLFNTQYTIYFKHFQYAAWIDFFIVISVITIILTHDKRPFLFSINLAILFFYSQALPGFNRNDLIWQTRNFFGVVRVYKNDQLNLHVLMNGSTLHGVQLLNYPFAFNRLTSYYQPVQTIANTMIQNKSALHVAIAGLGNGLLGCQFRPSDQVTFFEINPNVIKIAKNPKLFTYLSSCHPESDIIVGDARLNIAKISDHYFDAIIIDVFSSDSIPMHLFTREAIEIYLKKLTTNGLLIFNISSRHVELTPVLLTFAIQHHLQTLHLNSQITKNVFQFPSEWVILTANKNLTQTLAKNSWQELTSIQKPLVWTDDFSNILTILK